METIQKMSAKYLGERILYFSLFLFFIVAENQLVAQTVSDSSANNASQDSSSGPSLNNIKKLAPLMTEAMKKNQEQIRKDEIMGYIYMGLGFSLVIAIAWFTTVLAKKRRLKEDEKRAQRAQMMQHQHPHRKVRR